MYLLLNLKKKHLAPVDKTPRNNLPDQFSKIGEWVTHSMQKAQLIVLGK